MATAREELEVRAQLRDDFSRNLQRIRGNIQDFGRRGVVAFKAITTQIFSLKAAVAGLVGVLALRQLFRTVTDVADSIDVFKKFSDRIGVSVEFLSKLDFASERAGLQFRAMAVGIQRLTRRMAEFRETGGGPAAEGFRILGEDITNAIKAGITIEELMPRLADRFSEMEDEQLKVLTAFKLFDSEGVGALQLLNKEFREVFRQAERFGAMITTEQAKAAEAFKNSLTDFEFTVKGLKRAIIVELLPSFTSALKALTKFIQDNREDIIDFFKKGIPDAFRSAETAGISLELQFVKIKQAALDFVAFFSRGAIKSGDQQSIIGGILGDIFGVPGFRNEDIAELNRQIESTERTRLLLEARIKQVRKLRQEDRRADLEEKLKENDERIRTGRSALEQRLPRDKLFDETIRKPAQREREAAERLFDETIRNALKRKKQIEEGLEIARFEAFPGFDPSIQNIRDEFNELGKELKTIGEAGQPGFFLVNRDLIQASEKLEEDVARANKELERQEQIALQLEQRWRGLGNAAAGAVDGIISVAEQNAPFDIFSDSVRDLGYSFKQNLADGIVRFTDMTNEAKFTFRDFANSIIKDIQRIAAEMLARQLIGTAFQAIGSVVGGIAGGGGGAALIDMGGGAGLQPVSRQRGGIVTDRELALLHPPEAIVPLPDGRSIPVQFLRGEDDRREGVTVVQNFNISAVDAKSFDERWLDTAGRRAREAAEIQADEFRRNPAVLGSFQQ